MLVAKRLATHQPVKDTYNNRRRLNEQTIIRKKISFKAYMVSLVVIVTIMAIVTVGHFSKLVAINYRIDQVEQKLYSAREEQLKLKIKIAEYSSLDRIEHIVKEELGYQYPQEGQTKILAAR